MVICPHCKHNFGIREGNDKLLLEFCNGQFRTIRQIANHLDLSVKNVIIRIPRLKEEGLIIVDKAKGMMKIKTRGGK